MISSPIIFSSALGVSPGDSIQRFFLYFLPIIFIVIVSRNVDLPLSLRDVVVVLAVLYCVFVIMSVVSYSFGEFRGDGGRLYNYFNFFGYEFSQVVMGGGLQRMGGPVGNPNQFGFLGVCVYASLILSRLFYRSRSDYILIGLIVVGVFVSQSRLSIGALAVLFLITAALGSRKALLGYVFVLVLALAVGGFYSFSVELCSDRFSADLNSRDDIWQVVLEKGSERPIIGHGLATSPLLLSEAYVTSPHSFYLQNFLEIGLLGLVPLCLFFFYVLGKLARDVLKRGGGVELFCSYSSLFSFFHFSLRFFFSRV